MKTKKLLLLSSVMLCSIGATTSCNKTGFKVGLLCLHGQTSTYDNNFIKAFEAACKEKGLSRDEYEIRTDVAEDYNKIYTAAKEWAEDGYKAIFADSFGHQYGMYEVAKEYPNTDFYHGTGTNSFSLKGYGDKKEKIAKLPNYHTAFAPIYEGRFLTGVAAGIRLSQDINSGKYPIEDAKLGYVGAYPYAEVISGFTAFYLGAKQALYTIYSDKYKSVTDVPLKMDVTFTSSWYNYSAENASAKALIKGGCKLISQHADSFGAPQACKEVGVPNITYNISTKKQLPDTYVAASRINWQSYFENIIDVAKAKEEKDDHTANKDIEEIPCDYTIPGEDSVELIDYGKCISTEDQEIIKKTKAELESGQLKVFDCDNFTVTMTDDQIKDHRVIFQGDEITNDNGTKTGHLSQYFADVEDNGDYMPDTNVIVSKNGKTYFDESNSDDFRSAPYFDIIIDGINTLN